MTPRQLRKSRNTPWPDCSDVGVLAGYTRYTKAPGYAFRRTVAMVYGGTVQPVSGTVLVRLHKPAD